MEWPYWDWSVPNLQLLYQLHRIIGNHRMNIDIQWIIMITTLQKFLHYVYCNHIVFNRIPSYKPYHINDKSVLKGIGKPIQLLQQPDIVWLGKTDLDFLQVNGVTGKFLQQTIQVLPTSNQRLWLRNLKKPHQNNCTSELVRILPNFSCITFHSKKIDHNDKTHLTQQLQQT